MNAPTPTRPLGRSLFTTRLASLRPDFETWLLLLLLLPVAAFIAYAPLLWTPIAFGLVGAAIVLLRFPWFIWVLIAALLPWTSAIRLGLYTVTDLLIALAIVLWFMDAVRQGKVRVHLSFPAIAALGYVAVLFLAAFQSVDLTASLIQMAKWLQFALVLLLLPTMIKAQDHVPWLVGALFTAAALQSLYGLYQFFFRVGPDWFLIQGQYIRAYGSFGQPNPFGGYLGLTLPVTVSVLSWLSIRPIRKRRLNWRDLLGWTVVRGLVVLVGAGLIASWSRGAWLAALIAAITVFWLSSTRIVRILSIIGIATLLFVGAAAPLLEMVPPQIVERFAEIPAQFGLGASMDAEVTDENFAVLERLAFWVAALRMWEASPWLGIGPGNFDAAYPLYQIPRWELSLGHAHNIYLNILAESGLVGLLAFLTLWISIVILAYNGYRRARKTNRWQAALSVGILGVVTHLAVHSFFDNLFVQGMFLHLSLWVAILLSLQASMQKSGRMPEHK